MINNDSDSKVNKIYFGAIKFARKSGLPTQLKEEFAAYCACKHLSGLSILNFKCAYIDFLRKENGRSDTEARSLLVEAKLSQCEYNDDVHMSNDQLANGNIERDVLVKEIIEVAKIHLNDKELKILAYKLNGLSQRDIASELGVCETRISQIFSEIIEILKTKLGIV